MITLDDVKEALHIDFTDQDSYLQSLLDAAIDKALRVSGISATITVVDEFGVETVIENPEASSAEFMNAILEDVASMYQSRGDVQTGSESSMATYRRHSTKPIF
jgi:hypothetical protein